MIFQASWGTQRVWSLLDGTLKLKSRTFPFARRKPNWRLPHPGHVVDILPTGGEEVGLVRVEAEVVSSEGSGFS